MPIMRVHAVGSRNKTHRQKRGGFVSRKRFATKSARLAGLTPYEKFIRAKYGDKYDGNPDFGNASFVAEEAATHFYVLSKEFSKLRILTKGQIEKSRRGSKRNIKNLGVFLCNKLRNALSDGDGNYFRSLADAVELSKLPADPVRKFLLEYVCRAERVGA